MIRPDFKKLSDEQVISGARSENPWRWEYRKEAERRKLTLFARKR